MTDIVALHRAAIVATMQTVTGLGQVHAYERFAKQDAAFRDLYKSGDRILGWHVRRVSTRETSAVMGRYHGQIGWRIRGFMSIDDAAASEQAFDALIETLRDAVRADESLGGVVDSTLDPDSGQVGLQLDDSGPVMFAGVLCHGCTLSLTTLYTL